MDVLFVHQNFPGQFKHLAPALAGRPGNRVVALTMRECPAIPGIQIVRYGLSRGSSQNIHPYVSETETKAIRGEACARAAIELRNKGFRPDVILGHPGWGEMLFLRDVWPDAKIVNYLEFYYRTQGADVGFDPEFDQARDFDRAARLRMKNTASLLSMEGADWGLSPTGWQLSTYPDHIRSRSSVIFDGIDTSIVRPNADVRIELGSTGKKLTGKDEIITFVNRNLEPYRGFHTFMRALPDLLARRPNAHIMIVGGDKVSYGRALPEGQSYRQIMMKEVGDRLDLSRVHFLGNIPYASFLNLMAISSTHVYLTYPFVLSWSMLESMSCGGLVIGSDTPPVREVLRDGENGLLVDFFSPPQIVEAVCRVLDSPDRLASMRQAARQTVLDRYDLHQHCLPRQISLVETLARGGLPASEAA